MPTRVPEGSAGWHVASTAECGLQKIFEYISIIICQNCIFLIFHCSNQKYARTSIAGAWLRSHIRCGVLSVVVRGLHGTKAALCCLVVLTRSRTVTRQFLLSTAISIYFDRLQELKGTGRLCCKSSVAAAGVTGGRAMEPLWITQIGCLLYSRKRVYRGINQARTVLFAGITQLGFSGGNEIREQIGVAFILRHG